MTISEVEIHQLENGLTILTKELHHVALASQWIWYRVGSRNEVQGKTGISHWVEHMQFKGTPRFPVQSLDHAISRDGGFWNAMTYMDWTTYFETMPSGKIDIALELEADRMVNSLFDPDETERERQVVISEREGNENEPMFKLGEAVRKTAFNGHPYRHEVIGEMDDLRKLTREDLYEHYRKHYNPSNVVIAIAGDFDTSSIIKRYADLYGGLRGEPARLQLEGDTPIAESQIEIQGPGDAIYLQFTYRAPAASQEGFYALMVLDSLLTGPSSLAMFGGGSISNKTSRLYQQVVEKDQAASVSGSLQATIDPYLYEMMFILSPNQSVEKVRNLVDEQIDRVQNDLVSPEEIERAVKQAKAMFAYGSENITNQAFWMGFAAMFADNSWFDNYIRNLEAVSREDVRKAAREYLDPNRRVIGTFIPRASGS